MRWASSLGGPAIYHGHLEDRPTLGTGAPARAADIDKAVALVHNFVWLWLLAIAADQCADPCLSTADACASPRAASGIPAGRLGGSFHRHQPPRLAGAALAPEVWQRLPESDDGLEAAAALLRQSAAAAGGRLAGGDPGLPRAFPGRVLTPGADLRRAPHAWREHPLSPPCPPA